MEGALTHLTDGWGCTPLRKPSLMQCRVQWRSSVRCVISSQIDELVTAGAKPPPVPSWRESRNIQTGRRTGERTPWPDGREDGRSENRSRRREALTGLRTSYFKGEVGGHSPRKLGAAGGGSTGISMPVTSEAGRLRARARVAPPEAALVAPPRQHCRARLGAAIPRWSRAGDEFRLRWAIHVSDLS